MMGIIGNLTLSAAQRGSGARLRDRSIATSYEERGGEGWTIWCPYPAGLATFWSKDGTFCAVSGSPRITNDRDLAEAARELGLAAACARRYSESGPGFLASLDGPFALAARLQSNDRALLAVDKLGVASLYYAVDEGQLSFSTELGAMRGLRGGEVDIDPQAIYDYLYFHFVPAPATVFKQVRRLPLGSFVEFAGAAPDIRDYWRPSYTNETGRIEFASSKNELVELLKGSVRREISSGKELGCFLSGGTDSSTLSGLVSDVAGEPARTYSIGFAQRGFDEIEYARIAARRFKTRHREYYVQPRDIIRVSTRLAEIYGQPFGNSSVVPTFCCAELAKADGVQEMIAGDGGDELFGGNTRYATQVLFSQYERVPSALRRYVIEPLALHSPLGRVPPVRKLRRYVEQALEPLPGRLQTYNYLNVLHRDRMLTEQFLAAVNATHPERMADEVYHGAQARELLNKMLAYDLKYTLADNDLQKVVVMCNAAGVSVAFPFLDQQVFEFAARLPADQKVRRFKLRYFFKKALSDVLPLEIIRKKKHGFGMPFGDWLHTDEALRQLVFDSMQTLKGRGIVQARFIDELCGPKLAEHANYFGGFIWILMVLELWMQWWQSLPRDPP